MSQVDTDQNNDHTYYGNGNSKTWAEGGNDTAGPSRVTSTADSETQSIGIYATFQAATSGTGGALSENNSNAPDSFCPSGWQLPYSGDGGNYYNKSKSFQYLMATYNYPDNATGSTNARSYPLSYLFSGDYYWPNGKLYVQGVNGNWWSSTIVSSTNAYRLLMDSSRLFPQHNLNKGSGLTLRCNFKLAS